MGSAIASVHMLRVIRSGLSPAGWIMVWLTFSCVALTAAGPFIFLARRYSRRLPGYPKVGDWLWALLGVPWVITAIIESVVPGEDPRHNPLFSIDLDHQPGALVPDRLGGGLGHLGHGSSRTGGADRGGPVDQSGRPDPRNRLADSMRAGHGRPELTQPADRRVNRTIGRSPQSWMREVVSSHGRESTGQASVPDSTHRSGCDGRRLWPRGGPVPCLLASRQRLAGSGTVRRRLLRRGWVWR